MQAVESQIAFPERLLLIGPNGHREKRMTNAYRVTCTFKASDKSGTPILNISYIYYLEFLFLYVHES